MSPLKRVRNQFVESFFLVGSLVTVLEVILPAIQGRGLDWQLMLFAGPFGLLIVFIHTAVAYMRAPNDRTAERVERALAAFEERLRQQPVTLPSPSRTQFKWIRQDITEQITDHDMPAWMPPTRR